MFFRRKKKVNGQAVTSRQTHAEATFIARDMKVEGNLICSGELHIDGRVSGSVRAVVCLVDVNASVTGDISADTVYIYGEVNGPIDAANVNIYASANVRGDVSNDTISIENGAVIQGSIRNGRSHAFANDGYASATLFGNMDQAGNQTYPDYRPVKVVNPRG